MKFNEYLKRQREICGYTQKQISDYLGVSTITIRQYEQGTREPNIEKILKLAVIFNVSLDDLMCLEDFKNSLSTSSDEC